MSKNNLPWAGTGSMQSACQLYSGGSSGDAGAGPSAKQLISEDELRYVQCVRCTVTQQCIIAGGSIGGTYD